ncbi:Periplasmic divalent cation tolerance protein CutA [Desulfurella amilsii]|uniref:Periplasmic divalent cation tolerance protein CutA n=1 Tax=Desulfurella amilsii TaxID=1562698 RepID=A0A1X4XUB5_9BACT|nr:divalent-cation tolerance protein CutA [Desulfurella amilsii]OSS41120.1 Periplasmic divalent cation tolerance protein CutA [Desulfurella amilsii]
MSGFIVVLTTADSKETLVRISKFLVERKLAACCQISSPIESFYIYKNKFENTKEWLCIIKTHKNLFDEVQKVIKSLHTYETPEIIQINIEDGDVNYLNWMKEALKL